MHLTLEASKLTRSLPQVFFGALQPVLPEKASSIIFANIDDILLFNTVLLSDLEERQRESRLYINTIGDVIEKHMGSVGSHYRGYCLNQANAARTLSDLKTSDRSLNTLLDVGVVSWACPYKGPKSSSLI